MDAHALIGRLADLLNAAPIDMPDAPRLLIAGQPKAGTTQLHRRMCVLSGLRAAGLVPDYGAREQELSELRLLLAAESGYVACHHTRYSRATGRLLDQFRLRTVVLTRDLADALVSTDDHIRREGFGGGNPMAFLDEATFLGLPQARRLDLLIDLVAPWHLQFYLSWRAAPRTDLVWARYEEIYADPDRTVPELLSRLGVPVPDGAMADVTGGRFNVGRIGRGRELLSPEQMGRLRRLGEHYPGFDLSPLGL